MIKSSELFSNIGKLLGTPVSGKVVHKTYSTEIMLFLSGKTYLLELPGIEVNPEIILGLKSTGALITTSKGVRRYFRNRICNKILEPINIYSTQQIAHVEDIREAFKYYKQYFSESFYLMNIWEFLSHLIAKHIHMYGHTFVQTFQKEWSKYMMDHFQLVSNDWGTFIFGQELKYWLPWDIKPFDETPTLQGVYLLAEYSSFRSEVEEQFQLQFLSWSCNLSGTSKSKPGTLATIRTNSDFENPTTALQNLIAPVSFSRVCRTAREMRGLSESLPFTEYHPSNLKTIRDLPENLRHHLQTVTIALFDTPHNQPGDTLWHESEGLSFNGIFTLEQAPEWLHNPSSYKDKVIFTVSGKPKLASSRDKQVTFSQEKFLALKDKLEKLKNFTIISEEPIQQNGMFYKMVTVSWESNEFETGDYHHVKTIFPVGAIKGISECLDIRLIGSHDLLSQEDFEPRNLAKLIHSRKVHEIDVNIGTTTIQAKQASNLIVQGLIERDAYESGKVVDVPNITQSKWISSQRTENGDAEDDIVHKMIHILESKNLDPTGKMYIYKCINRVWSEMETEFGTHLKAVVVRSQMFRTRHGDSQEIGGETQVFTPQNSWVPRGVSSDPNVNNLSGSTGYVKPGIRAVINELYNVGKQLSVYSDYDPLKDIE